MASWKKLIVSGSDAELATVCTSGGITGAAVCSKNYFTGEGLCGSGNICVTGNVIATDASLSTVCATSTIQSDTLVSSSVVEATTLCGYLEGTAGFSCCSCFSDIALNAGLVNIYSSSADIDHLVTFSVNCTGCQQIRVDDTTNDFKYNPSSSLLTVGNVFGSTLVCSPFVYGTEVRGDLVSGSTVYGNTVVCSKTVYATVSVCSSLGCFDTVQGLGGCFETSVCSATITTSGNAIIGGDLIVNGTTTYLNTTNLAVEDRFILLNSGSNTPREAGLVVDEGAPSGSGHAFVYDNDTKRWGFTSSLDSTTGSVVPDAFAVAVVTQETCGVLEYKKAGNIFVCTNSQDIYIWS